MNMKSFVFLLYITRI